MTRSCSRRRRTGFTLVELLVVIVIIGILVALLLPAIFGAVKAANNARVSTEIQSLAQSLQSFKTKYGDFPPSRIILHETGDYSDPSGGGLITDNSIIWVGKKPSVGDITYAQLAQRSLRYLRKFFPRVQFSTSGAVPGVHYDFNGDGVGGPPGTRVGHRLYLEGHECLVFFLGGIPNQKGAGQFSGMGGFSNSPTNPFVNESLAPSPRSRPLFEFNGDRLVDTDGNGIPGYVDSLGTASDGRPFLYFSAYGGNNYDANDVNDVTIGATQQFGAKVSPAPNPYTAGAPVPTTGTTKYANPESYQIISSGRDREYGVGGEYTSTGNGDRLPLSGYEVPSGRPDIRYSERDNVTNFSNGALE